MGLRVKCLIQNQKQVLTLPLIQCQILTQMLKHGIESKMSYSESEAGSNFAINSVSDSNSNVKTWDWE